MRKSEAVGGSKENLDTAGQLDVGAHNSWNSWNSRHKPEQVQTRSHLNIDRRIDHDVPTVVEELVATVSFWKRASPSECSL